MVEKRKEILRRDLDEGVDFVVVSRGAWNLLHSWFVVSLFYFLFFIFLKFFCCDNDIVFFYVILFYLT